MAHFQNIIRATDQFVHEHAGEDTVDGFIGSQAANNLMDHGNEENTDAGSFVSQGINLSCDNLHSDILPYAMMTKTCYIEFDPMNPRAKLPASFAHFVSPLIDTSILLDDKNLNNIQVSVQRKNGKIYFTDGWSRLKDFYDLGVGGWITLSYFTPLFFKIKVRKITGIEVAYPNKIPPYRLLLIKHFGEGSSNGPVPFFVLPASFYHRLEKTLTSSDVESGTLVLFWRGFCESAFPHHDTQLTFIDWLGNIWYNCHLQFENNSNITCKISGDWRHICKMHRLSEGVTVKFGVTEEANNTVSIF